MKNENKCFFSISLENGITLTAEDPKIIGNFLYDMHSAFYELIKHYNENKLNTLSKKALTTMMQIGDAIETIYEKA